jgi:hypothetical protein
MLSETVHFQKIIFSPGPPWIFCTKFIGTGVGASVRAYGCLRRWKDFVVAKAS